MFAYILNIFIVYFDKNLINIKLKLKSIFLFFIVIRKHIQKKS